MKPTDFIDDMYHPDDLVALVLVSQNEEKKTQQRIWNAKKPLRKRFRSGSSTPTPTATTSTSA